MDRIKKREIKLITKDAPFQFIESYKSLRTNLNFVSVNSNNKIIILTSSIPGEGKSTVALNLAITLAASESKVLIIDCDLRKPMLHKYLGLSSSKIGGLTNILSDSKSVEECIVHFNDIRINFLSSGPIPPNPAEILGSNKMKSLIKQLSEKYDYILLDTPPVSVVTDAAVLSNFADGVLFVVRQNYANVETAQIAKKNLENVGAKVIGCVLNNFKTKKSNKSYDYYSYKYEYTSKQL